MAARQHANSARKPGIVIVGLGRLGSALALQLHRQHWRVSVCAERLSAQKRARKLRLPVADSKMIEEAAVFFLSVPDRNVQKAAEHVASLATRGALVHCAGALSLAVIAGAVDRKRPIGSFHPLRAISTENDTFKGYSVAISATTQPLRRLLGRVAKDLGLRPINVRDDRRPIYHAGSVLAAAGAVALAGAAIEAFERAGVSRPEATRALLTLMCSALQGVEQNGLEKGLTGPVVRGDSDTVRRHLTALPAALRGLYSNLGLRALKLSSKRVAPRTRRDLFRLFSRRD